MRRHLLLATLVASLAAARGAAAQPATFTLEVSPTEGSTADTYAATVQLEVLGVSGPERYWQPDFGEFRVIDRRQNRTMQMSYDPRQGQVLRSGEIYRYLLQPRRAGRLLIKPAKARIGGVEYETRSVVVKVRDPGAAGAIDEPDPDLPPPADQPADPTVLGGVGVPGFVPPAPSNRGDMFLHVVADKRQAVVGEQVTVTWLLYTRTEILRWEPKQPNLDGFWSEKLYEPDSRFRYHEATVGNLPYAVTILSKRALFPAKAGKLTIPPYAADVSNMNTPLGQPRRLASPALDLQIKPLPEGAPAGFDPGYVGVFTVEVEPDRRQIDAGESLTLHVTVKGEGPIRRTSAPALVVDGLEITERGFDQKVDASRDVVRGQRVYHFWAVPQRGGAIDLPAVELPYFNPTTGRYEVARSQPLTVTVAGDPRLAGADQDTGDGRDNVIARDIRLNRSAHAISSRIVPFLYRSHWFWLLAGGPPAAFLAVLLGDRVRARLRRETPRARLRRARGRARRRLRVAEIHLRGNRPPKFFGELARVLHEHLEDRIGRPIQSMTRPQLRELLTAKGFPDGLVERLDRELESADFARFAPSASGPGEMKAALRRVRELLAEIERTRLRADGDDLRARGSAA